MKKYYELDEELRKVLDEVRVQMQTTVISYPERNPHDRVWGANNYPGNCSGKVALGFVDKLRADSMFELCAGSGTNYDMCKDYDIGYCGIDLNPNPVRNGIKPMDLTDMTQEFPDEIRTADMIFSHMPYPGINRIKYSNGAWKDIVTTTLKNIHGNASLNDIYNQLEGHEKTKSNEHWKEKVRQTLQRLAKSGVCKNTSRGYWSLAA